MSKIWNSTFWCRRLWWCWSICFISKKVSEVELKFNVLSIKLRFRFRSEPLFQLSYTARNWIHGVFWLKIEHCSWLNSWGFEPKHHEFSYERCTAAETEAGIWIWIWGCRDTQIQQMKALLRYAFGLANTDVGDGGIMEKVVGCC